LVDEASTASHLCLGQAGQRNVVKAILKKIKRDLGHWPNHERKSFNIRPQSGGPKAHKTQQPSRRPCELEGDEDGGYDQDAQEQSARF
jgi:hypothetical protein